jgi:hypothetical protein
MKSMKRIATKPHAPARMIELEEELRLLSWKFFLHGCPRQRRRIIRAYWKWSGRLVHLRQQSIPVELAILVTTHDVDQLARADRMRSMQTGFGRRMLAKLKAQNRVRVCKN